MSRLCPVPKLRVPGEEPRGPRSPGFLGEASTPWPRRGPVPVSGRRAASTQSRPPRRLVLFPFRLLLYSERFEPEGRGLSSTVGTARPGRPQMPSGLLGAPVRQDGGCRGRRKRSPSLTHEFSLLRKARTCGSAGLGQVGSGPATSAALAPPPPRL